MVGALLIEFFCMQRLYIPHTQALTTLHSACSALTSSSLRASLRPNEMSRVAVRVRAVEPPPRAAAHAAAPATVALTPASMASLPAGELTMSIDCIL